MKDSLQAAALHLAQGAIEAQLKDVEIPPGHHNVSRFEVTLTFSDLAYVDRAKGTQGDGLDERASAVKLTANALLLYLQYCGHKIDGALIEKCLRDDIKGDKCDPNADVLRAVESVQLEQPITTVRTPAKRTGAKEVSINVKRLPKEE